MEHENSEETKAQNIAAHTDCTKPVTLETLEFFSTLRKDIREAAAKLEPREVRYLVDLYYQIQDYRIASAGQIRSMTKDDEPTALLSSVFKVIESLENEIRKALDIFSSTEKTGMGLFAKSVCGIGPVISSGLIAHIDITTCCCPQYKGIAKKEIPEHDCPGIQTVGHIWKFAGMDPTCKWEKKTKRPWNADLKVLLWKAGESFVKVQNNDKDIYGKIFVARKALETSRNDAGLFADQATAALKLKNYSKSTEAYKHYSQGKLPPAHIHARARRYAVKLFLSHWFEHAYFQLHGVQPPLPYPIAVLGHAHKI